MYLNTEYMNVTLMSVWKCCEFGKPIRLSLSPAISRFSKAGFDGVFILPNQHEEFSFFKKMAKGKKCLEKYDINEVCQSNISYII